MTTSDGFRDVFGADRGLNSLRDLQDRLASSERELAAAHGEAALLRRENDALQRDVDLYQAQLDEAHSQTREANRRVGYRERERDLARRDYARARYVAARAGVVLPGGHWPSHHGCWTPGRPYMTGHHVLCPETNRCFHVAGEDTIAPAGARPGRRRVWELCDGSACPPLPQVAPLEPHPLQSGHALRQTEYWWDARGKRWRLDELSREHLLALIDWLDERAQVLHAMEWTEPRSLRPCPVEAYPDPASWLHDTPLWQAVLAEKTRRRIRRPASSHRTRAATASKPSREVAR
jgi:hypothetical protein